MTFSFVHLQVESNRRYNALTSTLKRHDVAALAERRRRNIVSTPDFDGCRCCYDPNADGHGEYRALIEYKLQKLASHQEHEELNENNNHNNNNNNNMNDTWGQKGGNEESHGTSDNGSKDNDSDDDDDDDEFDYLLDEDLPGNEHASSALQEFEAQRRAELEFELLARQMALQHGYGTHRQLHPVRVLKAAGLASNPARPAPPAVVLHLVDPDSIGSASLDFYLETDLASKYPGTMFMRSGGRSTLLMDASIATKAFGTQLQAERDMPALVAIRDGVAVNICPRLRGLCAEDDGPIEPHAVRMWLEQSGVLMSQPPRYDELCFIRPEEDALMDYLAHQKPQEVDEEERYDCGVEGCSKTFAHEHVGIKNTEQDGLIVKEDVVLGSS